MRSGFLTLMGLLIAFPAAAQSQAVIVESAPVTVTTTDSAVPPAVTVAPSAVPTAPVVVVPPGNEQTVVVPVPTQKPFLRDAITGKYVDAPEVKEREQTLRDRVRSKMKE